MPAEDYLPAFRGFYEGARPHNGGRHTVVRKRVGRLGRLNCKLNKLEKRQARLMSRGARTRKISHLAERISKVREYIAIEKEKKNGTD